MPAYDPIPDAERVFLAAYDDNPSPFIALQVLFPALSVWMQQRFAGRIIAGEEPDMAVTPEETFPMVRPYDRVETADAQDAFRAWMEGTGSWRDDFA